MARFSYGKMNDTIIYNNDLGADPLVIPDGFGNIKFFDNTTTNVPGNFSLSFT